MLPSFLLTAPIHGWSIGFGAIILVIALKRMFSRRERYVTLRLLLARPLWWLAARMLALPDAEARYKEFGVKALARWEGYLLDNRPDRDGKSS